MTFTPTFSIVTGQLTGELNDIVINAREWERFRLEEEVEELGEDKEWWGRVQRLGEKVRLDEERNGGRSEAIAS